MLIRSLLRVGKAQKKVKTMTDNKYQCIDGVYYEKQTPYELKNDYLDYKYMTDYPVDFYTWLTDGIDNDYSFIEAIKIIMEVGL